MFGYLYDITFPQGNKIADMTRDIDDITIIGYDEQGDAMLGIDLNRPILYKHSSLRYFGEGEHHVSRFCRDDVLVMVFDGVLRFCEDGVHYEIRPGHYHIQRSGTWQEGTVASDAPKYLYVHFLAEWGEGDAFLHRSGAFEYGQCRALMEELDALAHSGSSYVAQAAKFYELLTRLEQRGPTDALAEQIAEYIGITCHETLDLDELCRVFHFSKNHIINRFKKSFGVTPIVYANRLRLHRAACRMEVTSASLEDISLQCGFRSYSHFYRLFCREYQMSPQKWREKRRIG